MVLDYLQTMWAQKPVCGLFANNVGSLAAIVGPTSRVFAANVSRQVPLFAGQPADDCGPLQVRDLSHQDSIFFHHDVQISPGSVAKKSEAHSGTQTG
jgi:hypothetical protein